MTGHAQLKLVMTECSKTQIRLTGLNYNNAIKYIIAPQYQGSVYSPFYLNMTLRAGPNKLFQISVFNNNILTLANDSQRT